MFTIERIAIPLSQIVIQALLLDNMSTAMKCFELLYVPLQSTLGCADTIISQLLAQSSAVNKVTIVTLQHAKYEI